MPGSLEYIEKASQAECLGADMIPVGLTTTVG